jgi:hypothetical protein
MTRNELVRRLAEFSTRPVADIASEQGEAVRPRDVGGELFVWFEDTSARRRDGRRGMAGLPESLLPYSRRMVIVDRHYVEGHLHMLSAVRIVYRDRLSEGIAALYTAALAVGTVAWIGTGVHYETAWNEMFRYADGTVDSNPDTKA